MVVKGYLTIFLLVITLGFAADLNPSRIEHKGYFRLPDNDLYKYGSVDMTYVEDCLDQTDPSPNDGYPGCIMHITKDDTGRFRGHYLVGISLLENPNSLK